MYLRADAVAAGCGGSCRSELAYAQTVRQSPRRSFSVERAPRLGAQFGRSAARDVVSSEARRAPVTAVAAGTRTCGNRTKATGGRAASHSLIGNGGRSHVVAVRPRYL